MREIVLARGQITIVDDGDYERLAPQRWYLAKCGYAARSTWSRGRSGVLYLHREVVHPAPGFVVDHINYNTLDNRRENLRVCRHRDNIRRQRAQRGRSSRFRGVSWCKAVGKWRARIREFDREIYLGVFDSEEMAARAYDRAAIAMWGESAGVNFPPTGGVSCAA